MRLPWWFSSKESFCQCKRHRRCRFNPWVRKIPWRRAWQPIQYFCLGNPMDRGAWWATVHRITKSWTWLKWLCIQENSTQTHSCAVIGVGKIEDIANCLSACLIFLSLCIWLPIQSSFITSYVSFIPWKQKRKTHPRKVCKHSLFICL